VQRKTIGPPKYGSLEMLITRPSRDVNNKEMHILLSIDKENKILTILLFADNKFALSLYPTKVK